MTLAMTESDAAIGKAFPFRTMAVLGLGSFWIALAAAETILGSLDALDNVSDLAAGQGRVVTAGLLHVLSGVLLLLGLCGVAPLAWRSRLSRTGWLMTAVMAGTLGAFGMLHLLAAETAARGLDPVAMQAFLVERLGGFGAWSVPLVFLVLLGPWGVALLLAGLARRGAVPWAAFGTVVLGALVHLLWASELGEVISHWVMAAGVVLAATALARADLTR